MKTQKILLNRTAIILFVIISVAFVLRIINLSQIPPGLNRDEAAIGYTAFSILKTGRDEYGILYPLSLKSFGDWKLPLYVYATVPVIFLFGLSEFSVRFPSVLFGSLTILVSFLITHRMFKRADIAIVVSALIAFSPWHLFFSRVSSEANLAVFLVSCGFLIVQLGSQNNKLLPIGTLIMLLSMLAYHGNHIFTPLLFLGLILFNKKVFWSRPAGILSSLLFFLGAGFVFSQMLLSADKTKLSGLFSLNDTSLIHEHIDKNRLIYEDQTLARIFNNKLFFIVENTAQNYLRSFSSEFLFIKGGNNSQHNIADFGNLYPIEAPFLLLGLYYLFKNKEKNASLLIFWLLIAPLGAALTKDAPHSARTFAIFPAISIVIGYGIVNAVQRFKKPYRYIIILLLLFIFVIYISLFLSRYFVLFPNKSYKAWGKGYKQMIQKLLLIKPKYQEVFVGKPENSPYIYYLFYQESNPEIVQKAIQRYPSTYEGFVHVRSFDGVGYKKIDWAYELLIPHRLYVDWAEGVPSGATNSSILITKSDVAKLKLNGYDTSDVKVGSFVTSRLIDQINQPDGSPLFYFIETAVNPAP